MTAEKLPYSETTNSILSEISEHVGIQAMAGFNAALLTRPMTADERAVFAASIHEFNRNTASGISTFAGRWTHHLMDSYRTWDATEKGSLILSAAVDEFGFVAGGRGKNHARILRDFTTKLGLGQEEIGDPKLVIPGARQLGGHLWDTYSTGDLDLAIGLHAASEVSSPPEFNGWKEAFLKFPEYWFQEGSEDFWYIREHAGLEVEHADDAQQALNEHLALDDTDPDKTLQGAIRYLELYGQMAMELTARIFPEVEAA